MANQPRQQRSRERRDALIDAAIAILIEWGPASVTHRSVASLAGVPVASTTYYFDSIAELIGVALQRSTEARTEELRRSMRESLVNAVDRGEAVQRLAISLAHRDRRRVALRYELYGAAMRDPRLMASIAQTGEALLHGTQRTLAILGLDPESAPQFLAMMEGFAVQSLTTPLPLDQEVAQIVPALSALISRQLPAGLDYDDWCRLPVAA